MSSTAAPQLSPPSGDLPPPSVQTAEQHRWLAWFGTPALVAAIFLAIALGTGQAWILGFTVVLIVSDVFALIMLVLTTDTNGGSGDASTTVERG